MRWPADRCDGTTARPRARRRARQRGRGRAEGALPARQRRWLRRPRDRRAAQSPDLQRTPQHRALRLRGEGGGHVGAGRGAHRRGPPPGVPAPRRDLLPGFPKELLTDGASSPLFVDLDGDNRNELVFGTSDGFVHALRRDGSSVPGWPVRTDALPIHNAGRAFAVGRGERELRRRRAGLARGERPRPRRLARDRGGRPRGPGLRGTQSGERVFDEESNPAYSGKPLSHSRTCAGASATAHSTGSWARR